MCLIGTTICSNLVLTMGLTSRRDYNRLYGSRRSIRSVKLNEIEDDWKLIEKQLSVDRKHQSNHQPIKSVSFSNFLKSRSPSQSDEMERSGKTKERRTKKRKGKVDDKRKDKDDGESGDESADETEDEMDSDEDDNGEKKEQNRGSTDGEYNDNENQMITDSDYDSEMQATAGLDLGILGHVDELMSIRKKNTIIPDGIHFDDSKLLSEPTKVKAGTKLKPFRRKQQVKVIRRSPNHSISKKLRQSLTGKRAQSYLSIPEKFDGNSETLWDKDLDPNEGDYGVTFDEENSSFGSISSSAKASPKSRKLTGALTRVPKTPSKRTHLRESVRGNGKKKSPLKMSEPLDNDLQEVDDEVHDERSYFDDSSGSFSGDYVVVPQSERGISTHSDIFPHQYNVEIRSRKKFKLNQPDSSLAEQFKKHEEKEEEHWHEKKWTKMGSFQVSSQFADQLEKRKRKKASHVDHDSEIIDENDDHFDIPSKGFRINKRFIDWAERKVDELDM
uniref:Uncharacterized protein n=1 Tax=Tetranychus urticae TaxID=32264 RepID=T1KU03_TETUR